MGSNSVPNVTDCILVIKVDTAFVVPKEKCLLLILTASFGLPKIF